ncbi:cytochrome b/b6 domain-containing protein [uncultured Rhodoblastus sp.]|uniref:cytochrome b/b6 domain-containing protein n=1 Tax=uncultured Rhodoblastus sp. TaxID=543037 RepID=UPI0025D454A3|nr:cytochrome b/b6 domain-containing protein [uncultured Rhodoblastus sp.]
MTESLALAPAAPHRKTVFVPRHALVTRLTHWLNALCIFGLLMSGLNIFMAHPALYWGQYGADADRPAFEIGAESRESGPPKGFVRFGEATTLDTTGVLGAVRDDDGDWHQRAFPYWATLPASRDLSIARRWHFFFAWLFVANLAAYYAFGLINGHLRRDLVPSPAQLRPSALLSDVIHHLKLQFPQGEAARHYNPLQKLAYLGVIGLLLPLVALTGMTMSPGLDAIFPWLIDLFGGRQSARTLHFIAANLIVLFVLVHLAMVVLAGPINEIRSMITGKLKIVSQDPDGSLP